MWRWHGQFSLAGEWALVEVGRCQLCLSETCWFEPYLAKALPLASFYPDCVLWLPLLGMGTDLHTSHFTSGGQFLLSVLVRSCLQYAH